MSFIRIYADSDGESHFEDLDMRYEEADFVPPTPALLSPAQAATTFSFERVQSRVERRVGTRSRNA